MPRRRQYSVYLETPTVCALAGLRSATLDYWARTGLVTPSVRGSSGRRVTRLWSVQDAVIITLLKRYKDVGCPLTKVRRVKRLVERQWGEHLSEQVLYWDGGDVLALRKNAASSYRSSQGLDNKSPTFVALPLAAWLKEAGIARVGYATPTARRRAPTAAFKKRRSRRQRSLSGPAIREWPPERSLATLFTYARSRPFGASPTTACVLCPLDTVP